jgi:hypothetical protein
MLRHLYFYTYIDRPLGELREVLAGDPRDWLPPPAAPMNGGWEVTLDAGSTLPTSVAQRPAVVYPASTLDDAEGLAVLRSISWRATDREDWFPLLEGDLELTEVGDDTCQLTLRATYRPPLSVVGAVGDRIVGHRVAEAVVREFVLGVAARLERAAA